MGTLLDNILEGLGPDKTGRFCFECGDAGVVTEDSPIGERFRCPQGHVSQRCYIFDGKAAFEIQDGRLLHETVGAVIRRDEKILLFRRTRFPVGFTIPAGHRHEGCDLEAEMRREVKSETGLDVTSAKALWPDDPPVIKDSCRRGADLHRWHVFEVEADGDVELNHEGSEFRWYSEGEVYDLAMGRLLTPGVREIIDKLGLA